MIKVTELQNVTYVTDISNGYYPCKKFVTTKNMQVCQKKEGKYLQNFLCINLHNFYICYPKLFFLLVVFNSCAKIVSIWFQGFGQCQCKRIYILQLWTVKVMWSCVPVPGCPWKVVGLTSESEKWEWKWKVRMKVNMKSESDMKLCPSARVTLKGWWVDKLAPNKFSPLKKTHFTTSANFLRISVESSGHHVPFCKGSKTNLMDILVEFSKK